MGLEHGGGRILFGVYLALFVWGGLYLREPRLRTLIPLTV